MVPDSVLKMMTSILIKEDMIKMVNPDEVILTYDGVNYLINNC